MKTNKFVQLIMRGGLASLLFSSQNFPILSAEENLEVIQQPQGDCVGHCINFNDISVIEFIRFVSKISEENFIYDARDLDFKISLTTGKHVGPEAVVQALVQLLKVHGLSVAMDSDTTSSTRIIEVGILQILHLVILKWEWMGF